MTEKQWTDLLKNAEPCPFCKSEPIKTLGIQSEQGSGDNDVIGNKDYFSWVECERYPDGCGCHGPYTGVDDIGLFKQKKKCKCCDTIENPDGLTEDEIKEKIDVMAVQKWNEMLRKRNDEIDISEK